KVEQLERHFHGVVSMQLSQVAYVDFGRESRLIVLLEIVEANAKELVDFVDGPIEQHIVVSHVEVAIVVDPMRLNPHQRRYEGCEKKRFEIGGIKTAFIPCACILRKPVSVAR